MSLGQKDDNQNNDLEILTDVRYICKSSALITKALQEGFDITQMANGDIIVTEIQVKNVQYKWDHEKNKMIRLGNTTTSKK